MVTKGLEKMLCCLWNVDKAKLRHVLVDQAHDFVIKEGTDITQAIQVTTRLHGGNRERELQGLREATSTYDLDPGLILTMEDEDEFVTDNVKVTVTPVWKWLLRDTEYNI